jgi:putative ABC transport system permease protein
MVTALRRKLWRELFHLKGQVFTIAMVVACGIACFITLRSSWRALSVSRENYYSRYAFADVFSHLKRAPRSIRYKIAELHGVSKTYVRQTEMAKLTLPHVSEPIAVQVVSLPMPGDVPLNRVYLRHGRLPDPKRDNEVLILESFAKAHHLQVEDSLTTIMNGRMKKLKIVGFALSPEFVLGTAPGEMFLDDRRFAVLWMDGRALAPLYQMQEAFNDVLIKLDYNQTSPRVIEQLDNLLKPYGGQGSYGRNKQMSDRALSTELEQLSNMATVVPILFLGVAGYLLNIVLARLIQLQRLEIATLKAIGYRNIQVAIHFFELVGIIVGFGALIGVGLGSWLGQAMTELYGRYFRFPLLSFKLDLDLVVFSFGMSFLAAFTGAWRSLHWVFSLPPAEAMRPPAPTTYRKAWWEHPWLTRWLGSLSRMVIRDTFRSPLRLVLSASGIALALAMLVVGRFSYDAMEHFMEVQFHQAQREDLLVTFARPVSQQALHEIEHLSGVMRVEGMRSVPIRIRAKQFQRDVMLTGHPVPSTLRRVLDRQSKEVVLPERGIVIDLKLAELLNVRVGDSMQVQIMEGQRQTLSVPVSALAEQMIGLEAHVQLKELHRLLGESRVVNSAVLKIDPAAHADIYQNLRAMPWVLGVTSKAEIIKQFQKQSAESMTSMTLILTIFAASIAVGIVYNQARVSLSSRSREFATLRVLGFQERQVSILLISELAIQVGLAIGPGLWFGTWLAKLMASTADPELYRLPIIISAKTLVFSVAIIVIATGLSALVVQRRIRKISLIDVLKTRD